MRMTYREAIRTALREALTVDSRVIIPRPETELLVELALDLPAGLRRLYLARDDDPAGRRAVGTLADRARAAGVEALVLSPRLGDFNEDLRRLGAGAVRASMGIQLAPQASQLHVATL